MDGTTGESPRDYRYYTEKAYHLTDGQDASKQLDVNDLVGTSGPQLEPSEADWENWRENEQHSYLEPNASTVAFTIDFFEDDDPDGPEFFQSGAVNILHILARRLSSAASNPFRDAIAEMMEPVRTVAVARLIVEMDREVVARRLSTSVETIDFLTEVALSHLEPLVQFRKPYVRPEDADHPLGIGAFRKH